MNGRFTIILIALVSLALGMATRYGLSVRDKSQASVPEPQLVDLKGNQHPLSEWRDKVLVVNFWATWCPPCREEMPMFDALQTQLGSRGVQIVGVAIDDPAEVRAYLQRHPVSYPILVGSDAVPAWADSLGNELSALPFTVIFDQTGRNRYQHTGLLTREVLLDELDPMLQDQVSGPE